jgi:hypothetical protein
MTNPIKREANKRIANNLGNFAVYETMNRTNNLTQAAKDLLGNKNFLYPQEEFQNDVLPEHDPNAGPLKPQGNFSAINIGYDPTIDKMGIGDSPEINSIKLGDEANLDEVIPHEFAHRWQDSHPLWQHKFTQALEKSGVNKSKLAKFVKEKYPKEKYEQEMFAYMFGEKNIPNGLKEFYKGIIK